MGIIDVFSPEGKKSPVIYCPEKPDPLQNAFDVSKIFNELNYRPKYSYIDQLKDFKHEMETEPFAQLWGTKEDYTEEIHLRCKRIHLCITSKVIDTNVQTIASVRASALRLLKISAISGIRQIQHYCVIIRLL